MKKLIALLLVLVMVFTLAACAKDDTAADEGTATDDSQTAETGGDEAGTYSIDVFMKSNAGDFWKAVELGAEAAGADKGVNVSVFACDNETNYDQQIQQIESSMSRNVDAIAIACLDSEALAPVVESATEKGIKVISFNGILNSDALAQAMGGKGKYVVLGAAEGVQNNRDRSEGCIAYITENYPDMELIASDYMDNDMSVATSMINDWITANPDLGGIFTNNETGTIAAATVFQERDKVGQIAHVGFDATVQTVAQITDGITDSIISQQPFKMGYLSVENCVALLNGEEVPETIDTGALLVTTENADSEEVNAIINPGS